MITLLVFMHTLTLSLFVVMMTVSCAAEGNVNQRVPMELLKQAEAEGSVRIIVEVSVGPQGIGAAQDNVLKALGGTFYRVTRRYAQIPFLALEVSPEALRLLATSPSIIRVQEDRVRTPQEEKTP